MSKLTFLKSDLEPHIAELIQRALLLIETKYDPVGTRPRAYHNSTHTKDIITATYQLASKAITKGKILPFDKLLLLIAAAYHDIEQDKESGENERTSAALAVEHMRAAGAFSEKEMETVKRVIMATQVHFDENGMMRQSASEDYLTQLIADADLASLGKPTPKYWGDAMRIFSELYPRATVDDKVYRDFVANQATFLSQHHFYTPEANELYSHKQENVVFTKKKAAELEVIK